MKKITATTLHVRYVCIWSSVACLRCRHVSMWQCVSPARTHSSIPNQVSPHFLLTLGTNNCVIFLLPFFIVFLRWATFTLLFVPPVLSLHVCLHVLSFLPPIIPSHSIRELAAITMQRSFCDEQKIIIGNSRHLSQTEAHNLLGCA